MSETADEQYQRERREDYEWWRSRTAFHPYSDLDKVLEDPSVILPEDGSFYIIANNPTEIKEFFYRLESLERLYSVDILLDPHRDSDFDFDEEGDEESFPTPIKIIENPKTLNINQYFEMNEQLQVRTEEEPHEVYEVEFDPAFLEDVTFPCLVQYSGQGGADRLGDFEINHCQVLNLTGCPPREGPVKIHLRWI